jgi:hypothetical protein
MPSYLAAGLSFSFCEIASFDGGLDRSTTQRLAQGAARGPDLCNTSGLAGKEPRHWAVREHPVISAVFLHDAPTRRARPARPASPRRPRTTLRKAKISSPHVAASNGAPDEAFGQMDKSSASGGGSGHGRWRLRGALNRKGVGTSLQESSGSRCWHVLAQEKLFLAQSVSNLQPHRNRRKGGGLRGGTDKGRLGRAAEKLECFWNEAIEVR